MKPALLVAVAFALSLSACGHKEGGGNGSAPSAAPVAGAPAPAGKQWVDVVTETPEGGFAMGNPDAPLKVVEFGSFTCPHCAEFAEKSSAELRTMVNSGKLNFEFRNYVRDPLDMSMGLIARCGGAEPFFPLMEQLFDGDDPSFGGGLFTLHLGDRLAAAHFHLCRPPVVHGWIISHDPAFDRYSPGILLFVELLASSEGIGYLMVWGRQLGQLDLVVVGMLLIGAVGVSLDLLLRRAESSLLGWRRVAF